MLARSFPGCWFISADSRRMSADAPWDFVDAMRSLCTLRYCKRLPFNNRWLSRTSELLRDRIKPVAIPEVFERVEDGHDGTGKYGGR